MSLAAACQAWTWALPCQHADVLPDVLLQVLLYLLPSAALAVVIRILAAAHPVFFLLTVAGTICHELAHYVAGWLTGAMPGKFTVIPRRKGAHWELGSVTLMRVRWYNAAPAALAPFAILLIPLAVALWRTAPGWRFGLLDLPLAFVLAPQLLSFWPSKVDWRIALRSWPYLIIIACAFYLFQFVNR